MSLPVIQPACPLCRGTSFRTIATYPELEWVECNCGLIYKRAESADVRPPDFYEGGYFGEGEQGRRYTKRRARRVQKSRHQILDMLNYAPPAPLLDIGCSVGYTLQAARELNIEPAGADVSEYAVKACREQGFRAEVGTLDQLPFADGTFGLVTMKHVIEHTPQPRAALAEVRRVLRPGGAIFIAVPQAAYWKARLWPQNYHYFLPQHHGIEHYVYYTPRTLARLLREEGFRTVRVNPALWHRHVPPLRRLGQMLGAPFRGLGQALVDSAHQRKEFWLTALRS